MQVSIAFQTNKTAADYIALAKQVNQYAFDAVSVYCDAPFHTSFAPLMLMAPHIERARLGIAALSPFRVHPIDIAAQAALLDDIAQAGIYIGIARGAWLNDYGIQEPAKPLTAIREAIDVIQYLLRGETGGLDGEFYPLAPHVRAPYPLPKREIPLLIGTWGKKLCALAGERAAEVKVGGSANPDLVPTIAQYINNPVVGVVMGAVTVVDDDRDAARALARREVALYLPVVAALDPTLQVEPERTKRIQKHLNQQETDQAAALISDDLLDRFAFAGNPADIIAQCERLRDAGTARVDLGTPHGIDPARGIQLIGEKVLPQLKS